MPCLLKVFRSNRFFLRTTDHQVELTEGDSVLHLPFKTCIQSILKLITRPPEFRDTFLRVTSLQGLDCLWLPQSQAMGVDGVVPLDIPDACAWREGDAYMSTLSSCSISAA